MSNVKQFYNKKFIQAQASLWISRIDRGLSADEQQELSAWCKENTNHYDALVEMATYWDDLELLNNLSGLFPLEQKQSKRIPAFAMAASFALVSMLTINTALERSFIPYVPSYTEVQQTQSELFTTQVGEQASFTLSDGSLIQLNTDTQIEISYTPDHRLLTLLQGEAQFDVMKDHQRPFTVSAGEKSFTALGTIFNIQKNSEQAFELVVTEGKVLISDSDAEHEELLSLTTSLELPESEMIVLSGEKATIQENVEVPVAKVSLDQVQRDLAWQQGMLIFEGETLTTALAEISRYTNKNFEMESANLADLKVAGYFKADDIDGLLASLKVNLNITHNKKSDDTIVLSLAKPGKV